VPCTSTTRGSARWPPRGSRYAERETAEIRLCLAGDLPPGPVIAQVGKLFLVRVLVPAATVFVVGRHGRVIVARDARNGLGADQRDGLIGLRGVAHEIAQVICRIDAPPNEVRAHGPQGRKVGVHLGDERVSHGAGFPTVVSGLRIVTADEGHAPLNSSDSWSGPGTSDRATQTNPIRGK